jgi:photosystem II stability/assembly factor-like uncharacterized protein
MYAPAISPHDPDLLFVACDMGGVYRSADGGGTWTMIDKRQLRDSNTCPLAFHPRDVHVVYAPANGGLKTSTDGGVTWTVLCADPPWGSAPCTALEVDEDDVELMLAGSGTAAYRSVDGGRSWSRCRGVGGSVVGIAVIPAAAPAGRTWLIATTAGIVRSGDGGRTWQRADAGLPCREVRALAAGATARPRGSIAYVTLPGRPGEIWRSTDEGRSWQAAPGSGAVAPGSAMPHDRATGPPEYDRVQTARDSAEIVYATVRREGHVAIHRSDDAGATWRPVVDGEPGVGAGRNVAAGWIVAERVWRAWRGASHGFAVSRRDPSHAAFTNAGEIYRTADGGASWTPVYSRDVADPVPGEGRRLRSIGLEVTSSWELSFDPHDPARAYICYTDIGFARSLDRGATWRHATRGIPWPNTVYQIAFDPAAPGVLYAACSAQHDIPHWTNLEGPRGQGGVCVSRDWGATWAPIGAGLPQVPATSIVLDPRSPPTARTLHVTQYGAGVYTSTDGGATWQPRAAGPGGPKNRHVYRLKLCRDGTLYCTITGRRVRRRFAVPGGLYRSRDGGRTWTELTAGLGLRWPGDVDTPPDDSRTIYLAAASPPGYPQGGVYASVDDGRTWRRALGEDQLSQALSTYAHVLFVTVDPSRPTTIYAGATTHGLFVSHDAGESWQEVPGIPFAGCQRVAFDPADPAALWVTTFGGGVWTGPAPR